jgi:hypothetical protein
LSLEQDQAAGGISDERTSVFVGKEGLAQLDLHGEDHGVLARVIRAFEPLTAEQLAIKTVKRLSTGAFLLRLSGPHLSVRIPKRSNALHLPVAREESQRLSAPDFPEADFSTTVGQS